MKNVKIILSIATVFLMGAAVFAGCGDKNGNDTACTHANLQKVEGRDPTCYEEGFFSYYKCECGAMFADKNGTEPTDEDDVAIPKKRHDMNYYDETVAGYEGYYFCNTCGRYYEDDKGNSQIPYEEMLDSSVAPVELPNNWTDPAGADCEIRNFTIRCFIGWTNSQGKDFSAFPASGTVWTNVNLNRKITLTGDGWYNFGVAYNKTYGLQYKNFGEGALTAAPSPEFTELFLQQGGIWVRIVRDGTNCSFYFEDKFGIPILISSNGDFKEDEALYRFALGTYEEVNGWTQSALKAEICWGIANPRCVFSQQ